MKKVLSIIALISILVVGLFLLTGCGENGKESTPKNEDTVIATKTEDEEGVKVKTTMEVTFKDNIAIKAVSTLEFENEETASLMYQFLKSDTEDTTLSGKTIVMKTVPEEDDEEVTKQAFIDEMTADGYTIQK